MQSTRHKLNGHMATGAGVFWRPILLAP